MSRIFDIARRRAEIAPDRIAFVERATGRSLTYRDLDLRAERAARILLARGLVRGDRVAALTLNDIAFFEILLGCAKAGLVLVPLNWRLAIDELAAILSDCTPRLLIHDAANADAAGQLERRGGPPVLSLATYEAETIAPAEPLGDGAWPADGLWYLLYTSGTTGRPKAVMQTFGMAMANYVNIAQAIDLTSADRTLNMLPLFHTAGINLHTLPTLIAGGRVTVMPKFDPEQTLAAIGAGEVTCFFGVPAIYQALAAQRGFAHADLGRVRSWGCGGAPLPIPLLRRFLDRGARVCNGYGMTETGPTVFLMDPDHVEAKLGSVGKAQILSQIRIVDADGKDVPAGLAGEVWIRGQNVTPGYWNNPEATRAAFAEDGWLKTGDVGRRDAEGYAYLVDRIKDMYISGGENVYPAEIEQVLLDHPDVLEAAVVGAPDERWGEVGRAFVVGRPGRSPAADALRAHCRGHLAAFKVPKSISLVSELPRTAAGKVQKHLLKDWP